MAGLNDLEQMPRGLGRRYAPDPRDRRFTLTEQNLHTVPIQVQPGTHVRTHPWRIGPILNQLDTEECTIFTAAGIIQAAPRLHSLGWTAADFKRVYDAAQQVDEFSDTPPAGGTSFRAVMKILQKEGLISSYLWVQDEATAREYLKTRGMLALGSEWFTGLDNPDKHGYVDPTGTSRGGHEYIVRWIYEPTHKTYPDTAECVNSWGEGFAQKGIFRMKMDAFRYLFLQLNGDLCSPLEPKKGAKK